METLALVVLIVLGLGIVGLFLAVDALGFIVCVAFTALFTWALVTVLT